MKTIHNAVQLQLQFNSDTLPSPDVRNGSAHQLQHFLPAPVTTEETGDDLKLQPLETMTFHDAARLVLSQDQIRLAPSTFKFYERLIGVLEPYWGRKILGKVRAEHLSDYQQKRVRESSGSRWGCRVPINHELGFVRLLLKRAGTWPEVGRFYHEIPPGRDYDPPGKAMTELEEEKLLEVFLKYIEHPERKVAALCSIISMRTTAGPGEIKSLKLEDIHLDDPAGAWFHIPRRGAKRARRMRDIPLQGQALFAMQQLVERARNECGCTSPDHFLLPYRPRRHCFEPNRQMLSWRHALTKMLKEAGIHMRQYDFRHHAVTALLESEKISEQSAIQMAGWVSPKMKERYSHTRTKALRECAAVLDNSAVKFPVQTVKNVRNSRKQNGKKLA